MSEQMMADVKPANEVVEQANAVESITAKAEDALYSKKEEEIATEPEVKKPEDSETEVAQPKENKDEGNKDAIEYKLTLKEGSLLDPSSVEAVTAFAKQHGLSNEAAQAVLENQEQFLQQIQQAEAQRQEAELEEWRNTVINDKTLGGANLVKTAENARKVVSRFGNTEFIKLLNETGYGDHPEVVRFLSQVGAAISDDSLIMPKAQLAQRSAEDIFYGKTN